MGGQSRRNYFGELAVLHESFNGEHPSRLDEERECDGAPDFPARAGPHRVSAAPVDALAAEAQATAAQLRTAADEHAVLAARTCDVLASAGARARTTAGAVGALLDAVARSEALVAAMARLAQQTGRVALNASIEAARANEAGQEFAAVAVAMRRLAQEGSAAAQSASLAAADTRAEVERAVVAARTAAAEIEAARTDANALAATLAATAVDVALMAETTAALALRHA